MFDQERHQGSRIQNRLSLLVQIRLVGRPAALDNAKELVFVAFGGFDINLSRQITLGVNLFVHAQGSVLRIPQCIFGVGLVNALADGFFIAKARVHVLALFAVNDGRTRILANRQNALSSDFGIAQHRKRHVLIVIRTFRIFENLCNAFIVRTAQHEVHIVESRIDEHGQSFGLNLQNRVALEITDTHIVLGNERVFRVVFADLKHRCIFKFRHFDLLSGGTMPSVLAFRLTNTYEASITAIGAIDLKLLIILQNNKNDGLPSENPRFSRISFKYKDFFLLLSGRFPSVGFLR